MRVSSNSTMTSEQSKVFGAEMRRLRKEAKLTTTELAKYLGVSATYISNLEGANRKPSPQLAERIAEAFDMKVEDMLVPKSDRDKAEREQYGKELMKHRTMKGYTTALVAGALGIPTAVYKEYEQGLCSIPERNVDTLNKLLGVGEEKSELIIIEDAVTESATDDEPTELYDIILKHVTDLKVDKDTQKKIWRYFTRLKLDAEERRLFG